MTEPAAAVVPARPSTFRIWLLAIRPATLPAALSGVVVGLGAALAVGTPFRLDAALGCLAVALLLQITANLSNDLSDFRKGADTPARTGPIRVAAAGLVTERQLEIAIALTIVLAGIVGLGLTVIGGPILLVIGVLAVVAAAGVHGRAMAVRLSRARRGLRLRLLRAGGRRRHGLPPGGPARPAVRGRGRSRSGR